MRKGRIRRLAKFLETLPEKKFCMTKWAVTKRKKDLFFPKDWNKYDREDKLEGAKNLDDTFDLEAMDTRELDLKAEGNYKNVCGTTRCIAGWTVFLWPKEVKTNMAISANAALILDLNFDQERIFLDMSIMTNKDAADALRAMADGRHNPAISNYRY